MTEKLRVSREFQRDGRLLKIASIGIDALVIVVFTAALYGIATHANYNTLLVTAGLCLGVISAIAAQSMWWLTATIKHSQGKPPMREIFLAKYVYIVQSHDGTRERRTTIEGVMPDDECTRWEDLRPAFLWYSLFGTICSLVLVAVGGHIF